MLRGEVGGNADALADLPPELQTVAAEMGVLDDAAGKVTKAQEAFPASIFPLEETS